MNGIENLIVAVEGFPCIWDSYHEDYFSRDVRDAAWEQICKEVHSNWKEFDGTLLINACNSLKKKWTHIRDYYRKDLYKLENTPPGSKRGRPYRYAPLLEFLRPTFERQSESDDELEQKPQLDPLSQFDQNLNENRAISPQTAKPVKVTIIKRAKLLDSSETTTESTQRESQSSKDDDDEKFLLSFRGDMKRMNNSQKLDFKIGMLQLVKKITSPRDSHDF